MIIRPISIKDKLEWSKMRTELWPDTADCHISEIEEFYSGKSVDIVEVFIVEVANSIVGFIELNIRNFAEGSRQSQVPYVEGWFIKEGSQNKGYGKSLMLKAEEWAVSKGFDELASDTELDNLKSIAIHKKLGYVETERVVCFLKNLND